MRPNRTATSSRSTLAPRRSSSRFPILAIGRFYHEAVAVDPATGFVYLSEDREDGLLYRHHPDVVTNGRRHASQLRAGDLARGGVLEALRIVGMPAARTQNWEGERGGAQEVAQAGDDGSRGRARDGGSRDFFPGKRFRVDWIRIPEPEPNMDLQRDPTDSEPDPLKRPGRTAATSTRAQGFRLGAAQFARTEGILTAPTA